MIKKLVVVDSEIVENSNYISKKDDPSATKYVVFDKEGIRPPTSTEVIEIINLDNFNNIDEIIENDEKRYIETCILPLSSKILLCIGDYVYGCFEYAEDQKNLEADFQ
ncbi:MAG: hypothetical protein VB130_15010 [Clostridium sp.]|nr:hypothetical protein [Clostridium sp.]